MLQDKNMAIPLKIPQAEGVISMGQEKVSWGYGGHG
jgi:predicted GNAT superfamily acetyltransferase